MSFWGCSGLLSSIDKSPQGMAGRLGNFTKTSIHRVGCTLPPLRVRLSELEVGFRKKCPQPMGFGIFSFYKIVYHLVLIIFLFFKFQEHLTLPIVLSVLADHWSPIGRLPSPLIAHCRWSLLFLFSCLTIYLSLVSLIALTGTRGLGPWKNC